MTIKAQDAGPETKDGEGESKLIGLKVNDDFPEQRYEAVIYDDVHGIVGGFELCSYCIKRIGYQHEEFSI
ncbi:MAG: hypothetical protein J5543_02790 [Bacteroidales bacterium]|jgi:hypothetical protein|nr:hypothetical protein [Bacteroidales bacterium]